MVCVVPKAPPPPTSYTTAFPATENPISQGGIWLNGLTDGLDWNDIQTVPGKAYAATIDLDGGGASDSICVLKRSYLACTRAQYAQATVFLAGGYSPSGVHEISLLVQFAIAGHSASGYEWYINRTGGSSLVRWNGAHGDFTLLGSPPTPSAPVDGDVLLLQIDASGNIVCKQNGAQVGSVTDTTFTAGNPGFGNNPVSGATVSGTGFKLWTGGNL